MKQKNTEFDRQVRSESLIPRGDASNRRQRWRGGGSSPRAPEKSTNTPGSAGSLLSHVGIKGDFDFKDRNDGNHFLACEIDSKVAARTYLERKKQCSAASKMQLELNMPKVNTVDTNIDALLQSKLLEPAVVKSIHTCRRIFLSFFSFFFFLLYLQTF